MGLKQYLKIDVVSGIKELAFWYADYNLQSVLYDSMDYYCEDGESIVYKEDLERIIKHKDLNKKDIDIFKQALELCKQGRQIIYEELV